MWRKRSGEDFLTAVVILTVSVCVAGVMWRPTVKMIVRAMEVEAAMSAAQVEKVPLETRELLRR